MLRHGLNFSTVCDKEQHRIQFLERSCARCSSHDYKETNVCDICAVAHDWMCISVHTHVPCVIFSHASVQFSPLRWPPRISTAHASRQWAHVGASSLARRLARCAYKNSVVTGASPCTPTLFTFPTLSHDNDAAV